MPESAIPKPVCSNCRWWVESHDGFGFCQRHAPHLVVNQQGVVSSGFPETDGANVCGDHEPISSVGASPQFVRAALKDRPVRSLDLSTRPRNALERNGIETVWDLISTTEAELLCLKNFSNVSLMEVKDALSRLGLALYEPPKDPIDYDTKARVDAMLAKAEALGWISLENAARVFGTSIDMVKRMLSNGEIGYARNGRRGQYRINFDSLMEARARFRGDHAPKPPAKEPT